jgi:hypothetical protein
MLPCFYFELEPLGSLKDKDDRTAQLEPAHFATSGDRLSTEEWRCIFVYSFRVVTGWWGTAAEICAQLLSGEWVGCQYVGSTKWIVCVYTRSCEEG